MLRYASIWQTKGQVTRRACRAAAKRGSNPAAAKERPSESKRNLISTPSVAVVRSLCCLSPLLVILSNPAFSLSTMVIVTGSTTPSTPPAIQRSKRQYGRPKLAAHPDIVSKSTGCARDSTIESSSVIEDSEPERVRYRKCFASTDLSDPPTSANKNHSFGNWRQELERIDAGEFLEPYCRSGSLPHVGYLILAVPTRSSCPYMCLLLLFYFLTRF